jgi:hemerythrin
MLWKEEYKLGVAMIDIQHKSLFDAVDGLLNSILHKNEYEAKTECLDFIRFLKKYCVTHFATEENYQRSVNYVSLEAHKKQHQTFTNTVQQFELDFQKRGNSQFLVRDFISTLITWIVYHIQGVDRMIMTGAPIPEYYDSIELSDCITSAIVSVFSSLFLADVVKKNEILYSTHLHGNIFASVHFLGTIDAYAVFSFSSDMLYRLICFMANVEAVAVEDDTLLSSMKVLTSTISTQVSTMQTTNVNLCRILGPVVTMDKFDTSITNFANAKIIQYQCSLGEFEVLLKELPKN